MQGEEVARNIKQQLGESELLFVLLPSSSMCPQKETSEEASEEANLVY